MEGTGWRLSVSGATRRLQPSTEAVARPTEAGPAAESPQAHPANSVWRLLATSGIPAPPALAGPRDPPAGTGAPPVAMEARISGLRGRGSPLPGPVRDYFEPRFGRDLGAVRIHAGGEAAEVAHAAGARALGADVVFAAGRWQPGSAEGRRLLAHELAHTIQQAASGRARVQRQREVLDTTPGATNVLLHPQAEPGSVRVDVLAHLQGGLVTDTSLRPRVSAVLAAGSTIRGIAGSIHRYFTTARPSPRDTVDSSAPTKEQLARALLVYSRYYLPVPSMTRFTLGLRLPLPIEIDVQTGEWIVSPPHVRLWAQSFEEAWLPLLDQAPGTLPQATNADLDAEVTAFLAEHPSALARGIALGAHMVRNPFAAELFVPRLLDRLGDGAFEVALDAMSFLVNHQVGLLAGLGPGAGFLWRLRTLLSLPPTGLSDDRERQRQRALRMIPTEYVLGTTAGGRSIEAFFFAGETSERALVIGGVHGTEGPGVDVARQLVQDLQNASSRPRFTTIVVPVLFPDNLDVGRGGGGGRRGRRRTRGHVDPNRQFPALGESLASARVRGGGTAIDAEGRRQPIEAENVILLHLIDRFRPSRIASVHAIARTSRAGIYADPHTRSAGASADELADAAAATQADEALAEAMGETARSEGATIRDTPTYPGGAHDPGVSLGGWAPRPIAEGGPHDRPSMTVITMELPRDEATEADVAGHTRALRDDFLDLEP